MKGFAPLRHRSFRFLVGGQLASNMGDACYAVALPWYVLASHRGVLLLATVLAAYGVPRTIFVVLGGHASDRWDPWTTMMGADLVRTVTVAVLGVAALDGRPSAVVLVPIAAVTGAGEGIFLPGSFSIVPSLLPDHDLQAGNAIASSSAQLATLAGPALGGALVAAIAPAGVFFIDSASFLLSALTLVAVREQMRAQAMGHLRRTTPVSAVEIGMEAPSVPVGSELGGPPSNLRQLVRSEPVLRLIFLVTLAANLGMGGLGEVALPALAHGPLHSGAIGYGGLIAALGGGSLIGTAIAGQFRRFGRPAFVASVAFLGNAAVMAVAPYLRPAVLIAAALVFFGALNGFGNVLTVTAVQRWAPAALLGRLWGLLLMASFGVFPISVVLGGVVVHDLGPAAFFPMASGFLAIAVLVGLTQPSWRQFGSTGTAALAASEASPDAVQL